MTYYFKLEAGFNRVLCPLAFFKMLFAFINGKKVEATPNSIADCHLCNRPLVARCGDVNVWHWAHLKDDSCDTWFEPETQWHKNWKLVFGTENSEILINKNGERHIADVLTNNHVVIELQNSSIRKEIISARENFYGESMIWIINGIPFKENIEIRESRFFEEDLYYSKHNPLSRDFNRRYYETPRLEYQFVWNWSRKSWNGARRHVFLDFGDEDLFYITEGMGKKIGKGKYFTKREFVKKYGGDIELVKTLITNETKT